MFLIYQVGFVVYFLNTLTDTRGHIKNYVPQQSKNQYCKDSTIPIYVFEWVQKNGQQNILTKRFTGKTRLVNKGLFSNYISKYFSMLFC